MWQGVEFLVMSSCRRQDQMAVTEDVTQRVKADSAAVVAAVVVAELALAEDMMILALCLILPPVSRARTVDEARPSHLTSYEIRPGRSCRECLWVVQNEDSQMSTTSGVSGKEHLG
jgi:hypothetical protein